MKRKTRLEKEQYSDPFGKWTEGVNLDNTTTASSYGVIGKDQAGKANRIISALKSPQDMVILYEILSLPKSLRSEDGYL